MFVGNVTRGKMKIDEVVVNLSETFRKTTKLTKSKAIESSSFMQKAQISNLKFQIFKRFFGRKLNVSMMNVECFKFKNSKTSKITS